MAFPTVESRNESNATAAGTSHVVSLPTGIASGDLLIAIIAGGGTAALQFGAQTGWSELLDENNTFGAHVFYRLSDGSDGATYTFTSTGSSRSAHVSYRISGAVDPGTQAPEVSSVATGTSDAPNPNAVTPTGGAKDYLFITFFCIGSTEIADTDGWCNNAATNYSNLLQKSSGTGGTNVAAILGSSERTANTTSEDAAWPAGSLDVSWAWRAFTIAVHPAPVNPDKTDSDSGTGSDASTLLATLPLTDAATSTDTSSMLVASTVTDAGTGTDVGVALSDNNKTGTDLGTAVDGAWYNDVTPGNLVIVRGG